MTARNALETPSIRQRVGEQEWQARVELAAAYRGDLDWPAQMKLLDATDPSYRN